MTIILSAGLSHHVEHSFDDNEDGSNSGRHLRHHCQDEEDEDELSETSKRAIENLNENLGEQAPAGGAISAPKVDGGAIFGGAIFSAAKGDTRLLLATGLASFAAGALTAPGNRDRIVAFIDIRITIAFLVTCGFVITEQCRAKKRRDGLDVMATNEQMSHENDGTSALKEKHIEEYRRGRERVLQALGSIHELPLEANDRIAVCDINAGVVQFINKCANFSEASSELMQTIDKCLEVLRIGSGLHIGIGPSSKSVCRVENTIVGREYRKAHMRENVQTSKHSPQKFSAPLGLGRAREILYCVMADHFELLNSLSASPHDGEVGCSIEGGEISLHPSTMSPLTLSSLVTWRKALGKLQSQLLAELCVVKGPEADNMKAAIIAVCERNLYLQSCFQVSRTNSTEENGSAQHVQQRHLDNIYRRIDAALVSIWAFENSASFPNDLDSEQQGHGECQSAKKEWWQKTRDMLLEAIAYWHELDSHLASTGTIKYEDEEDFCLNQYDKAQGAEYQRSKNDGTFECANEQVSSQKISNGAIAAHPTDKTIVFSGKANRRRLRDKKSGKDGQDSNAPQSSSYRNNLFTELQSRIDMIELADEWDAHQEREDRSDTERDEDVPQGVNEDDEIRTSVRRAMPLVLGGGSLLEELKESTVAVAETQCKNEVVVHVFGD